MTLDEALSAFHVKHSAFDGDPKTLAGETLIICSGGQKGERDPFPALYLTEDAAAEAWLDAARKAVPSKRGVVHWKAKPEMQTFQVTVMDMATRLHRVSEERYAVLSRLMVCEA